MVHENTVRVARKPQFVFHENIVRFHTSTSYKLALFLVEICFQLIKTRNKTPIFTLAFLISSNLIVVLTISEEINTIPRFQI